MSTINVRNAYIAFITKGEDGEIIYGTPEPIKGLRSVNVNPIFAEGTNYGDGVVTDRDFKLQGANLSVEWNKIPLNIQARMFNRTVENGETITTTNDKPMPFAFGYEEEISKGESDFFWYYDCIANPMGRTSEQSTDNISYGSDTLVMVAKGRDKDGFIERHGSTTEPDFVGRETWFSKVEAA